MNAPYPTGWTWLLFSVDGRINRGQIWRAALIYVVIVALLVLLLLPFAIMPIVIITLWCAVAVLAKRLHDRGRSGWWIVGFNLVQMVLDKIGARVDDGWDASLPAFAAAAVTVWAFVEIFCLKGTRGPNRYGPDPLGEPASLARTPL